MEKITRLLWTAELDRKLSPHFDNLNVIRQSVQRGHAELYEIDDELLIVVRPELMADGQSWELVWLISFGRHLNKHIPALLQRAKEKHFKAVRYHCDATEKAVVRLVSRHGGSPCETIYRLPLEE